MAWLLIVRVVGSIGPFEQRGRGFIAKPRRDSSTGGEKSRASNENVGRR